MHKFYNAKNGHFLTTPPYISLYNRITYPTPKLYNTNSNHTSPSGLVRTTSQQNTTNQRKIIDEIAA